MPDSKIKPLRDFFCIEISPIEKYSFDISITKKSRVGKNSMVVTSPELQNFLFNTPQGAVVREKVDKAKWYEMGFYTGSIMSSSIWTDALKFKRPRIIYDSFQPLNRSVGGKQFAELLRGSMLGTLIEARILRHFKEKYPKRSLHFGEGIQSRRKRQLGKFLGSEAYEKAANGEAVVAPVKKVYEVWKKQLKEHAKKRHTHDIAASLKARTRRNKAIKAGRRFR